MKGDVVSLAIFANCVTYLVGTTSNVILILVFYRCRTLQTRLNSFIMHLSFVSAVRSSFIVYSKFVNLSAGTKHLNSNICNMIAMMQVSISIQTFILLGIIAYARSTNKSRERRFAGSLQKDWAVLEHIVIIAGSIILAIFGLGNYFYDDARCTCSIQFSQERPVFEKVFLTARFLLVFIVLCFFFKAFKGNASLIYPLQIELKGYPSGLAVTPVRHKYIGSSDGAFREQSNSANGGTSNGNTKSTELVSTDNSPFSSSQCGSFKDCQSSINIEKHSFASDKSIDAADAEKHESGNEIEISENLNDYFSQNSLKSVAEKSCYRRPRIKSAKYRHPNSFDYGTESELSDSDQIVVFSAMPADNCHFGDDSFRETSFCLEVEDLRTGKRFKTNDIDQISEIPPARNDPGPEVDVTRAITHQGKYKKACEINGRSQAETNSDVLLSNSQCSNLQSSASIPACTNETEAQKKMRENNFFKRFTRVIVPSVRTVLTSIKRVSRSNKVSSAHASYEQTDHNLNQEISNKNFDASYIFGKCDTDEGIENGLNLQKEKKKRDKSEFDHHRFDLCHFVNGQKKSQEISCIESQDDKLPKTMRYLERSRPTEGLEGPQMDILRFKYTASSSQVTKPSRNDEHKGTFESISAVKQYLSNEKRLTVLLFAISCSYIALSLPMISLEFLSGIGVWKRTKIAVIIADIINDLTVFVVPILYGYFCREFRREISAFCVKRKKEPCKTSVA